MLALGIRYLNGFVAAAESDNLEWAEWPPHPGRVFMAMVSAHFQTGADSEERAALLWLEGTERSGEISVPAITAAGGTQRAIVRHYVPVNDKAGPSKAMLHSLPLTRDRQDRVFARAWLEEETVYLHWSELEIPIRHREALARLCSKVTRIGHSTSLVQMWLADGDEVQTPSWVPDDKRSVIHLRIPGPGTLEYLERQYNEQAIEDFLTLRLRKEEAEDPKMKKQAAKRLKEIYDDRPPPRQRPRLAFYAGYAPHVPQISEYEPFKTVFSPYLLTFRLQAKQAPFQALDLATTLAVTNGWRGAILSQSNGLSEEVRRMLSGHDANGGPAIDAHLALMPLAFVGHDYADGHLLGIGIALPSGISTHHRREALCAVGAVRELRLGPLGTWTVKPVTDSNPPWNLKSEAWTAYQGGATHWSTVTPIAFDRHPKAKDKAQYQQETAVMIAEACTAIGLPSPIEVIVTSVSAHPGVPLTSNFPRLARKDGSLRRHSHAILVFEKPVCGPVLLGAGRFRGYGVCRPLQKDPM